jgi:hypothetical protein
MDDSIGATVSELVRRTAKHWGLWVSGAVASVSSFVLPALGVPAVPASVLLWIGLGLVVIAFVSAFHDVRVERDVALSRLEPKFDVSDTGTNCYHEGINESGDWFKIRLIVVTNSGGTTIDGVRVELDDIRPDDEQVGQKLPLLFIPQHRPNARPDNEGFSLNPGASQPINVLAITQGAPDRFQMYCAPATPFIAGGNQFYRIRIQITGRHVPSVTRMAQIGSDEAGNPTLTLLA